MNSAKQKIEPIVRVYKELYPTAYKVVCAACKAKRNNLKNKYGDLTDKTDIIERPLLEYPENIYTALVKSLSPEEMTWFSSKAGVRWFGRKYPEFLITDKI